MSERSAPIARWVVAVLGVAGAFVGLGTAAASLDPPSDVAMIFVNPHPDDEYQHWALLEESPDLYSLVVLLTRGEQSGFCEPEGVASGWQEGLEPAPEPIPDGRFTDACAEARIASFTNFFRDMGQVDDTVPSDFGPARVTAPLPDPERVVCRLDEGEECITNTTVEVLEDARGRGALLIFDLGDGDVTEAEVAWAVHSVLNVFVPELLPETTRVAGIIGGYSTPEAGFPGCFSYPHPDHLAVDRALWTIDFGTGFQASATCATDPRRQLYARVSALSTEHAFRTEPAPGATEVLRTGAHTANYGWLHAAYYPVSTFGQGELFHQGQHYWVRYW